MLLLQGLWTRWRTPRLPEPAGPRAGASGQGPLLRLLILGDSAAAGVGATVQDDALAGQLVRCLAPHCRVQWQLEASTGHRTADTRRRIEAIGAEAFDAVVISVGVNDVTGITSAAAWRRGQRRLRRRLTERFAAPLIISCGLPPMHRFPALPQPLRWCLGRRASQFAALLETDVAEDAGARFLSLSFTDDRRLVAADGFHPGPGAYAAWAAAVAALLRTEAVVLARQPGPLPARRESSRESR